jgi:ABC-type bacteriocin/lantibiotic exporter with double-glycine peptidase domain
MRNISFFFITLNLSIKIKLIFLLLLSIILYFLEFIGIGLIPVVFYYLASVEKNNFIVKNFPNFITENFDLLNYASIEFIALSIFIIFVIKNLFLIIVIYYENKVINNFAIHNINRFFSYYFNREYSIHLTQDINKITRNIIAENENLKISLLLFLNIIKEFIIIFLVIVILFLINPVVTFSIIIFFSMVVIIYHYIFNKKLNYFGKLSLNLRSGVYKFTLQALSLFREIKLSGAKNFFLRNFLVKMNSLYKSYMYLSIVSRFSKSVIELSFIFVVISILIIFSILNIKSDDFLLIASIYIIYSIRLLPSFNSLSFAWARLQFFSPSIKLLLSETANLEKNLLLEKSKYILNKFNSSIKFENVTFSYLDKSDIFKNINLNIKKGFSYGIFGRSGSGKTTLVNLIMGLLKPTSGKIILDGKYIEHNFRFGTNFFSYISQDVILLDDTIKNNIIFNSNKNDIRLLKKICGLAELNDFIRDLPNGLDTLILDGGKNLSGGQKQRISIARALYQGANIIIMDEPTSALDDFAALRVVKNIKNFYKKKTVIIISHKLDLLRNCSKIFLVKNNKIISVDNYVKLKKR